MSARRLTLSFLAAMLASPAVPGPADAASWGEVATPAAGPARIIGGPTAGCIAGAVRLPPDGVGYQAVRVSRNRHFGHPATVSFVERLGRRAAVAGLAPFYVGDMAQPRGGPMSSGHGSHQSGLDVDIWFNLDPKPPLPAVSRETVDLPSMVLADGSAIDEANFGERQVRLLRLAATDPVVDRIFVHWTIKRALCDGLAGAGEGDRSWLHRIRPWWGHDSHFHVRLGCPANSPGCVAQAPVPPGDGCDASLDWWFQPHPPPATPVPPPQRPKLPAACRAVLAQP